MNRLLAIAPLALTLTPAALAAPAIAPAMAAPAAPTLGAPRWDARAEALVIPVSGPPPVVKSELLERPARLRVTLKGRPGFTWQHDTAALGKHPSVTGYLAVADRAAGTLRVSFLFRGRAVPVATAYDRTRRAMVLVPLYPGKKAPTHGVPLPPSTPPQKFISPRPRPTATPTPSPTQTPVPAASPTPTPAPSLTPSPAPTPVGWDTQGSVELFAHRVDYTEINPGGDLLVLLQNGRMFGARYGVRLAPPEPWRTRLTPEDMSPYWNVDASAYTMAYVLSDRNLPFSHRFREDSRAELSVMRELRHDQLWVDAGLGYFWRIEEAYNTGVPPDLSQAFTFNRFFHAPMGRFSFAIPPEQVKIGGVPGWKLYAEYDWAPRVLADLDKGLPGLPALGFGRYRMGIQRDWGPFKLNAGYAVWTMSGLDFEERFQMPQLSLTWTTHLP
jgi:hypothetical protein